MASISSQSMWIEDKTMLHVIYGLFAASPLFGIPTFLALSLNLMQYFDKNKSELIAHHLKWQRTTAFMAVFVLYFSQYIQNKVASMSLIFCASIWFLYRIARGWLCFHENHLV